MEKILCSFSNPYVIIGCGGNIFDATTPKEVTVLKVKQKISNNLLLKILRYILLEIKISFNIIKISNRVNLAIFFMEADAILPVLTSKVLGLKVIRILPSSISLKMAESHNNIFYKLIHCVNNVAYFFSDKIILYSSNLISEWNLEKFSSKIIIANRHFLDFSQFKSNVIFSQRNNFIGYIGRFSEEKGVMNFVESIPLILKQKPFLNFLLIGGGNLTDNIKGYISEKGLEDKVELTGWVSHENLPKYLNSLKLLVIPSFTEGLPNIMLEAIACGTPVLATPVGAISDVIRDGETGFIMGTNSPDCISKNIIRALEHPQLENIIRNARELIVKEYTYEAAVQRYVKIIGNLKEG